jgi:hypothetical protein
MRDHRDMFGQMHPARAGCFTLDNLSKCRWNAAKSCVFVLMAPAVMEQTVKHREFRRGRIGVSPQT